MSHPEDASGSSGPALSQLAAWPVDQALQALDARLDGLDDVQVRQRLKRYGLNQVSPPGTRKLLVQLAQRVVNPLNFLLCGLALLSLLTGNAESATLIFLMVMLSITLGFVQERRSDKAAVALRAMVHTTAAVLRRVGDQPHAVLVAGQALEQKAREVPMSQLVPGDVVHLSVGDLIPADVRLITARDFFVNEAALTGESLPVEKYALTEAAGVDTMALRNACFMGTHVASGSATAVVVNTGPRAVFGGIAQAMTGDRGPSSFDVGLQRFTWLMLRFMLVMVPLVFLVNGLSKGNWMEALLFATAVAVGLTPEMLPMLVTVNLAKGALTMSRKQVIVKRLQAIQNFGAMDVLCTDKTGTLTQDRIILEKYVDLDGQPSDWVLDFAYLNSYYQSGLKSQLDQAVLQYTEVHDKLHAQGEYLKVDEIPFDFQRRRMSVVVEG